MRVKKLSSHNYLLEEYTVDKGLKVIGEKELKLLRGSSLGEGIPKQDGFLTEQLLQVAKEYLESVNVGELKTQDSTFAIEAIKDALFFLNRRAEDRKKRGVQTTYKK